MKPEQLAMGFTKTAQELARNKDLIQSVVLVAERYSKQEAPVKRGTLRRSIVSRVDTATKGRVGTNLSYAPAVHNGSGPHVIRAKSKKALYWKGAAHPVRSVRHPGTKANPFFERGIERGMPDIEQALSAYGLKLLSKVG